MSALYDLIFTIPLSVSMVLMLSPSLFPGTGHTLLISCSILSSAGLVALYHLKARGRIIIAGLAAAVISGTVLAGKGDLITGNLRLMNVLIISILVFILIKLSSINPYGKPALALILALVLIIRLILGIREEKILFCMAAVFILPVIAEWIQRNWKKEGATGTKGHLVFIFPFLLPAILAAGLISVPDKPYDWHHVKNLVNGIRDGYEALLQMLSPEEGWDGGDNMGFSERAAILGSVGKNPYNAMTVVGDAAGDYRLYLSGKSFDRFDGRKWTKTDKSDMNYGAFDLNETRAAILQNGPDPDDLLKSGRVRITYEGMRTGCMFALPKSLIRPDDAVFSGGDLKLPHGRKGDYTLRYYRLNRDDPSFINIAKAEADINKEAWQEAMRFTTDLGPEQMTYDDYRAYRRIIYNMYGEPVDLSDRCKEYLDRALAGAKSDYEKLDRLEKLLSSFGYSTSPGELPDDVQSASAFADYFLMEKREGFCTHYATAFVLLARSLGIPARYVQGYSVLSKSAGFEVTSDRTHAWPEAYLDGVGWIIFEPTPGFRQVMGWDISDSFAPQVPAGHVSAKEGDDGFSGQSEDAGEEGPATSLSWIVISLLAFAVFLALFIPADRMIRKISYRRLDNRGKVISLCKKSLRMLRYAGSKPYPGETVFEFKERIKETVPEDIVSLLYIYERSLYAKDIPDDDTVSEAEELSKKCSSYVISQVFRRDHTGKP